MNEPIDLSFEALGWSLGMIGICVVLSRLSRLDLEGQLIIAAGRSILQLMVVGYVIAIIFELDNPLPVLLILGVMISIAAIVAKNRINQRDRRLFPLIFGSLLASSTLSLGYTIALVIQPERWYSPQYLIPLMGMVLGNAMNSASLAGERLTHAIERNPLEIETRLSLGASPQQAIETYQREAIRASLIPTLNQMMVVGLVSLPGMFTGQVLAGSDPLNAAAYQILILFAIALANLLTAQLVTEGIYRRFFNQNWQLKA
jgi:putative ABC transport system permease protein